MAVSVSDTESRLTVYLSNKSQSTYPIDPQATPENIITTANAINVFQESSISDVFKRDYLTLVSE